MFRFLFTLLPFLLLQQTPPAGDPPEEKPKVDDKPKVEFTPEQQARVNDIEAKARKDAEDRVRADVKANAEKQATKDKEQREREEAEKRGEFDTVKANLEGKVTKAEADLEFATTELEVLRTYVTADIKAAIKDLPKALIAFDPGEDASIADRLKWLATAKANAADLTKETKRGAGFDPPASGITQDKIPPLLSRRAGI